MKNSCQTVGVLDSENMQFTVSIGDLALLVGVVVFLIRLEGHVKILRREVSFLTKTVADFLTAHISPINSKLIRHDEKLDDYDGRLDELELFKAAIARKLDPDG